MSGLRGAGLALLLILGLSIAIPTTAAAAEACRVIDPELQGPYAGPCVGGLAQGQGVATGLARYEGTFQAGRKHGTGTKSWSNGDRYEGEFRNDLRHGHGSYVWGQGSEWARQRYTGAYEDDMRHGVGVYAWPDGRRLSGLWERDLPSPQLAAQMGTTVRAYAERLGKTGVSGATVCRALRVGISEIDTIRGVVQKTDSARLYIRVTHPGRFGQTLNGQLLQVGTELVDFSDHWFPCR